MLTQYLNICVGAAAGANPVYPIIFVQNHGRGEGETKKEIIGSYQYATTVLINNPHIFIEVLKQRKSRLSNLVHLYFLDI